MEFSARVRVGVAGWSYKDWEGVVYPHGLPRRKQHPLEILAQCFDLVEINTSFYGHIRPELAKLWCHKVAAVNPEFRFTAKLNRAFTHSPLPDSEPMSAANLRATDEDEACAKEGLDVIAEKGMLGALLIQFPFFFKNTPLNREYLEWLLHEFIEYPRAVEVRHESWDNPETLAMFTQHNVAFCNIDQPLIGRSLGPTEHVTSGIGYVRLHGRNYKEWFTAENVEDRYNYLYREAELVEWKEKIETLGRSAETVYVVTNNHFEGRAAVNALQLKNLLTGTRVKASETLLDHYPVLRKIADPLEEEDNEGRLFAG